MYEYYETLNLRRIRFKSFNRKILVYIKGGNYNGKIYSGCGDKTPPKDLGWIYVPYRLYFAKRSQRWDNMGIAFLSCNKEENLSYHTIVRL